MKRSSSSLKYTVYVNRVTQLTQFSLHMFLGLKIRVCADFLGGWELSFELIFGGLFPGLPSLVSEVFPFFPPPSEVL